MTEQEIFDTFPHIYRERHLPMDQTCMCWGLEVADEWLPALFEMSRKIQLEIDTWPAEEREHFAIQQVKSKFGGLRVYHNSRRDKIDEIIDEASEGCRSLEKEYWDKAKKEV